MHLLVDKKATRSVTHYKVYYNVYLDLYVLCSTDHRSYGDCYATWELEKDIPSQKSLKNLPYWKIDKISSKSMGQTSKTLNITRSVRLIGPQLTWIMGNLICLHVS